MLKRLNIVVINANRRKVKSLKASVGSALGDEAEKTEGKWENYARFYESLVLLSTYLFGLFVLT